MWNALCVEIWCFWCVQSCCVICSEDILWVQTTTDTLSLRYTPSVYKYCCNKGEWKCESQTSLRISTASHDVAYNPSTIIGHHRGKAWPKVRFSLVCMLACFLWTCCCSQFGDVTVETLRLVIPAQPTLPFIWNDAAAAEHLRFFRKNDIALLSLPIASDICFGIYQCASCHGRSTLQWYTCWWCSCFQSLGSGMLLAQHRMATFHGVSVKQCYLY